MRGNSRKNSIDVKNYLVMFFKHEDVLYSWTQFQENQKPDENCALYKVCQLSRFMFFTLDNKSFLFLQDEQDDDGNIIKQYIKKVTIFYNFYNVESIYESDGKTEVLTAVNLDQTDSRLLLISKS